MYLVLRRLTSILIVLGCCQIMLGQAEQFANEDFENCTGSDWIAVSDVNDQNPNDTWTCRLTAISGFTSIEVESNVFEKDWLISPEFNLSNIQDAFLDFRYTTFGNFEADYLSLLYSTDFNGNYDAQSVDAATWQSIDHKLLDEDTQELNNNILFQHPSIPVNDLQLSTVYFAFQFTSDRTAAGIWLDDIRISGNYYNEIETQILDFGESCSDLKTTIYQAIRDHDAIPYTDTEFDVWDSHYHTDQRLNDNGTRYIIWDMYSDNPNGAEPYEHLVFEDQDFGSSNSSEGAFYNREHSFPKSWWGGSQETVQFSDIHMVIPADKGVNSERLNYPYGNTNNPFFTSQNGCRLGNSSSAGYSGVVFEPIDEYKGDVARMSLYMAVRYQNVIDQWENFQSSGDAALSGNEYIPFEDWQMNLLLDWHENDPVSQKEIDRNNAVFAIQNNRNPFIDHPEYAGYIWGNTQGENCDDLVQIVDSDDIQISQNKVYPNPSDQYWILDLSQPISAEDFNRVQLFDAKGRLIAVKKSLNNTELHISNVDLVPGVYYLRIDSAIPAKVIKL